MFSNHPQPEMWREIQRQHEEQRKIAEAYNRGKAAGIQEERAKAASQKLLPPPAPTHQQITNDILRHIHATLQRIEQGLSSMKLKGTPVKGVRVKDGKVIKNDSAPPHARQARRRKAGKVTGVKPAR